MIGGKADIQEDQVGEEAQLVRLFCSERLGVITDYVAVLDPALLDGVCGPMEAWRIPQQISLEPLQVALFNSECEEYRDKLGNALVLLGLQQLIVTMHGLAVKLQQGFRGREDSLEEHLHHTRDTLQHSGCSGRGGTGGRRTTGRTRGRDPSDPSWTAKTTRSPAAPASSPPTRTENSIRAKPRELWRECCTGRTELTCHPGMLLPRGKGMISRSEQGSGGVRER